MSFTLRDVLKSDLDTILEMMVRLATHEKMIHRLNVSKEMMLDALFEKNADWHCVVAEVDEKLAGFVLYSFANLNRIYNPTPHLFVDDIFVDEPYRSMGIAQAFFEKLKAIAVQKKIQRIELWCMKENQMAQRFYEKLGAQRLDYVDVFRLKV